MTLQLFVLQQKGLKLSETLETLKKARALISNQENWCKGAREKIFMGCRQFCATGAIGHSTDSLHVYGECVNILASMLPYYTCASKSASKIVVYNDRDWTNHSDILKLFDKAISHCEKALDTQHAPG